MSNRYIVIMAGGKGERFWPCSRMDRPKHLLPIISEKPMIAETVERAEFVLGSKENIFIITNKLQKADILKACPELNESQVIGEPVGRDTAAAVALATRLIKDKNPEATFAILPADHVIHDKEAFKFCLEKAFEMAESEDYLVTLGVEPTYPATGYGYIEVDGLLAESVYKVKQFVEKPVLEKAEEYLASGNFFWNAGMFVWSVKSIEKQLALHTVHLHKALFALEALENLDKIYPELEKISIDYAILEKAQNILSVKCSFDWDDAGEWLALERHCSKDLVGNTVRGHVISVDANNNIVVAPEGHTLAIMGVSNMIIVSTEDATLVCRKEDSQNIKKIIALIREDKSLKHLI